MNVASATPSSKISEDGNNYGVSICAMNVASTTTFAKISENGSSYGVSIGTVEAQNYYESGLNLDNFENVDYVAQTSDGTYMGFKLYGYRENDDNGDEKWINEATELIAVFSTEETVTIPDCIKIGDVIYPVDYIGGYDYISQLPSCVRILTIPSTVKYIYDYGDAFESLHSIYMLGAAPETYGDINVPYVYVCNESDMAGYISNSGFSHIFLLPYGWDFEWLTVNVNRKGEFAQNYIELTDADWNAGIYVKITGLLNSSDLENIKKLTGLRKLDLSEAEFDNLPDSFLSEKQSLLEIKLPESLTSIPKNAFYYCSRLLKVTAPGVTTIQDEAFEHCWYLVDFDISNVTVIKQYAFYNCNRFNPTKLSDNLKSLGAYAFSYTSISKVVIPEGIKGIPVELFCACKQLTEVSLPFTLEWIGSNAFASCSSLKTIDIPEGVTEIYYGAFYKCKKMTDITLPSTLYSIGFSVFEECSSLNSIKCKSIMPPKSDGSFTEGLDLNHCTLYVAPFVIDAYRDAEYWDSFYIMKPLSESIKNIYVSGPITFDLLPEYNTILQNKPNITLDYRYSTNNYSNYSVGQLSVSGEESLSAGLFKIYNWQESRQNYNYNWHTSLINDTENLCADSVLTVMDFEKNKWHFISFPYDVKMSDIVGWNNTDFVIREYDGRNRASGDGSSSNWKSVSPDNILKAGQGYIIQAANNLGNENVSYYAKVQFPSSNSATKNNIFTSKDVAVELEEYPSEFAHNSSWNLVGNPYPCYYDMHCLKDEFTTPIILWRGTSYQAYSPVDDDIILKPNEAFFVQRPVDKEHIVFGKEGRMHYDTALNTDLTPGVFYASAYSNISNNRNVFNFNIKGCGYDDRARIVINEEALMEYEINRDASKFFAETNQGVEIFVDGDVRYDICERPLESGVASLGVRVANKGLYTISLNGRNYDGWNVLLTDTKTGICVDLVEAVYEFEAEAGEASDRFIITFKTPEQNSIEEIAIPTDRSNVRVATVSGVIVYEGTMAEFMNSASKGVYIVIDGQKSSKLVVK